MPLPVMILALASAAIVLSAAALIYALRGRRVDDHPICRRCGFDLFGKPEESRVCSECGADLGRRRAVRVGQREPRVWLLRTAGLLLAISVAWSGLLGWDAVRKTDWNRYKPVWWLMRDVDGRAGSTRDAALVELGRRIGDGTLPTAQATALVDRALDWQADTGKPWSPRWGVVVESARAAGGLPYAKWERYMAQSVTFTLEPFKPGKPFGRAAARDDDDDRVGLRVRRGPDRVGNAKFKVEVQCDQGAVLAGRHVYPGRVTKVGSYTILEVPAAGSSVRIGAKMEEMIVNAPEARGSPAAAPTRATVTVNVWPIRSPDSMVASLIAAVLAKAPVPQPVEVTTEWTTLPDDPSAPTTVPAGSGSYVVVIEPADGPSAQVRQAPRTRTVRTTAWPDYRDEVEASLHVAELTYSPADGTLTGTLECRRPPIALAYDLTLHPQGGSSRPRDVSCGSVNFDRGGNGSVTFSRRIPNLSAGAADLFLEYSDRTSTSGLPADAVVWSSAVVLRNVPIRRVTQ